MTTTQLEAKLHATLDTPSDLDQAMRKNVAGALNVLLADMFALFVKAKNFHWHMSGPHFRDYYLLLDEQAGQIFETIDAIAERVRKLGGSTIKSVGDIGRRQRLLDNDADFVDAGDMLAELREDNKDLIRHFRATHDLCDEARDIASASLIENWLDEAEQRVWFLFEASRNASR
jgi:starvation-inducible DNA-binding protein